MKRILFFVMMILCLPLLGWSGTNEIIEDFRIGGDIKIGNAQTSGGTGGGGQCITASTHIVVTIANLVGLEAEPDSPIPESDTETPYSLPEGYPPIFLSYDFPNESGIQELTTFYYQGEINGEPYYSYNLEIVTNIEDWCTNPGEGDYEYYYSLTYADGSLYNIHAYSAPGDIFSCQLFELTCHDCEQTCENESAQRWPYWSGYVTADCDCEAELQSSDLEEDNILSSIEISPNPFKSEFILEIEFKEKESFELVVIGSNGNIIQQWSDESEVGNYRKRFSTASWPAGIYFLKVKKNDVIQTSRIVKLD